MVCAKDAREAPSGRGRGHPGGRPHFEGFESAYKAGAPWDIGRPQPELIELADSALLPKGRLLDVGCGRGDNALLFAEKGWEVVGVDAVPEAIASAQAAASERGLAERARFVVGDALDVLPQASGTVDAVIDSGFFHGLTDPERVRFAEILGEVLRPAGVYAMLSFSDRVPGDWGPRRVGEAEIRAAFTPPVFEVVEVRAARFASAIKEMPLVDANLALVRRL